MRSDHWTARTKDAVQFLQRMSLRAPSQTVRLSVVPCRPNDKRGDVRGRVDGRRRRGVASGNGVRSGGAVVPREQICDAPGGMVGDTVDRVGQPSLGIDAVEVGGLDQTVAAGGTMAALIRALPRTTTIRVQRERVAASASGIATGRL